MSEAQREKHMLEGALAILSHVAYEMSEVKTLGDLDKVKVGINDLAKQLSARLASCLQQDLMLYGNFSDIIVAMFESDTPQETVSSD